MKTLLLILLPFVGMCQKPKSDIDLLSIRLSVLFSGYKEYCYSDSSLISVNVNTPKHFEQGESHTLEYLIPVYEKKWIHRAPTFEGFMEYVESLTSK